MVALKANTWRLIPLTDLTWTRWPSLTAFQHYQVFHFFEGANGHTKSLIKANRISEGVIAFGKSAYNLPVGIWDSPGSWEQSPWVTIISSDRMSEWEVTREWVIPHLRWSSRKVWGAERQGHREDVRGRERGRVQVHYPILSSWGKSVKEGKEERQKSERARERQRGKKEKNSFWIRTEGRPPKTSTSGERKESISPQHILACLNYFPSHVEHLKTRRKQQRRRSIINKQEDIHEAAQKNKALSRGSSVKHNIPTPTTQWTGHRSPWGARRCGRSRRSLITRTITGISSARSKGLEARFGLVNPKIAKKVRRPPIPLPQPVHRQRVKRLLETPS